MGKEKGSEIFALKIQTIGETQRLKIICLLADTPSMCVSEVAFSLEIPMANASHHLRALAEAGILSSLRNGKQVCYSLCKDTFTTELKKFICALKIV